MGCLAGRLIDLLAGLGVCLSVLAITIAILSIKLFVSCLTKMLLVQVNQKSFILSFEGEIIKLFCYVVFF